MLVRKMTLDDIREVTAIEKLCFSLPWSDRSFVDSLSREDTIFLVCEEKAITQACEKASVEETVTGYIGLYVSFDEASITNVAVAPSYRKKGYGEALVMAAKKASKEAGAENIFLEVRASNQPAISLYKKLGFEELGIRKKFYQHPVEDAIIMKVGI